VRVRLTRSAEQDLIAIADWIRQDNPVRAISFAEALHARCLSPTHRPKRFPIVRTVQGAPIRKLAYRDYLIFNAVGAEHVHIRILHGARHWRALLGEEA
jgi:toxin ParE1/3/4